MVTLLLAGCGGTEQHPSTNAERPSTQVVNAALQNKYVTKEGFASQIAQTGGRIQLSVDLSYTKLTDEDLAQIVFPQYMTTLDLTGCPISNAGLAHLIQSENLRELDLSHTMVTEECLNTLERMPVLEAVHLHGTAISPDVQRKIVRIFRQRSPRVEQRGPK